MTRGDAPARPNRRSGRAPRVAGGLLLGLGLGLLGCGDGGEAPALDKAGTSVGIENQKEEEVIMEIPEPGHSAPLQAGMVHHRDLELAADEFVRLLVRQQGIDVELRLRDPAGERMIRVDSPSGPQGPEELVAIAPETGGYRLEVAAFANAEPGRYAVEALDRRPATADDRRWVEADRIYRQARQALKAREYAPARDAFRSILPTWQELELRHREAATHEQLGNALVRTDGPAAALDEYEQAAVWFRALGERLQLAANLQKAATALLQLGQTDQAIAWLEEAMPIFEEHNRRRSLSTCLSRLGFAQLIHGRPQEALGYLERSLVIAEELNRSTLRASVLTDMGKALLTLHRSREALERYSQAVELYRETEEAIGLETALAGVANAAAQLGDPDQAEKAVNEAMGALGPEGEPRIRAALLITLGHLHRLRGDLDSARDVLAQAQTAATDAGEPQIQADALLIRGYVEVLDGAPERGLALLEPAFELYERVGQTSGMASSRARAAQALFALGRYEEAWRRLEPALAEVERFRAATLRRDHRLAFFASFRQDYFEIARDVLLRLHHADPGAGYDRQAFAVDERRRSRELLDSLAFRGAEPRTRDSELLANERRLEQAVRDAASEGPSPETSTRTAHLIDELHRLRAEIRGVAPVDPSPVVDLDRVQKELLDDDTLLLVYSLGEERSVLWAVTRDQLRAKTLDKRRDLESWAGAFVAKLVSPIQRNRQRSPELGRKLSDLLLAPVAEWLGDRRLVIVADGELQTVPFAALPEPGEEGDDVFLVRRHEIVYLPSVSALEPLHRRHRERPEGRRIAAFGDPVYDVADPRVTGGESSASAPAGAGSAALRRSITDLGLADPPERLPESRTEVEKIVDLAGGDGHLLALDFEASRETFHGIDGERYAILHIAAHALMHPQAELSGLLLSKVDEQGRPQDGFLPAIEISRLHLPLDLVVLSACETGAGRALRGEGVLGLAWAFLDAGAARVLASLWRVSDQQTAALMIELYDAYLKQGLPPAAALRQAQLVMAERPRSLPYDWAGFVIQGDWR